MVAALSEHASTEPPWTATARDALPAPLRRAAPASWSESGALLAQQQGPVRRVAGGSPFVPRLRANARLLRDAQHQLSRLSQQGQAVGAAGDWLLDHLDSLAAQTRAVRDGLPRRFYGQLPVLAAVELAGTPRVLGLAWRYVELSDSRVELGSFAEFLKGYQSHGAEHALQLGEHWALPTTLRVVLIENLRRLVERVLAEALAREAADQLLRQPSPLAPLLARQRARGVDRAFALQLLQGLHGLPGSVLDAAQHECLRRAMAAALPDAVAAARAQQDGESADAHSVAQAIASLRALDRADWRGLLAQSNSTVRRLLQSPVFAAEDEPTQDRSLRTLAQLAARSGRREPQVAAVLLRLVDHEGHGAATAPGFWLAGGGRRTLWHHLGLRGRRVRLAEGMRRLRLPLYLLVLLGGSLALAWAVLEAGGPPAARGLALALALAPASELITLLAQRLLSEWLPTRPTPRLALRDGIPAAQRVLVVIPALLHDATSAPALAEQLALHHLANREPEAQFALLTDFADAPTATQPGDATLLDAACAAVDALEARYPPPAGAPRRFLLLHRARQWCETERAFIGWERKRGKLQQLLALLAVGGDSPFIDLGARSRPRPQTRLLMTLDADTRLPPGTLRALVGVAAHPLNQPRLDSAQRRVVRGHGILQPGMETSWPAAGEATPFHRLFGGLVGSDPYHAASSEAYHDLFGEASFSGKGLLHVAAVHTVLAGRLPEQQVLSHDLVEGLMTRCGAVSDIQLSEPAPRHPDAAAGRLQRWTRGDWQLLPLLARPRHYALGALGVWKLLDNLRRPLVAPAALALLALALLAWVPVSAMTALGLGAAALAGGPLLGALLALPPQRRDLALGHFLRQRGSALLQAALAALWLLALWPRQSAQNLGAIARALWRSAVSHRHLLQWLPSDRITRVTGLNPGPLLAALLPLGAGAALLATGRAQGGLALGLGLLWASAPLAWRWAGQASTPAAPPDLEAEERAELLQWAQASWRYFDEQVSAATHHLPPDNVQSAPETRVALRTSPTNIGLYLTALGCAQAFGWITPAEFLRRVTATLDTLERLPRHRGHVLNWIDLGGAPPLRALEPAYVSTVDSGNLCLCLLNLGGALAAQPGGGGLAARCRRLADEPDFGFLYDPQRRLLHIGWRVAADLPDPGHYDLLASEARLASLWAIAKGDVPVAHWQALERPLQAGGGEVGLRSWSGSMFEYLMPPLLLPEPSGSLLGRSAAMAIAEQRRWAAEQDLPWGVSECAHATVDASQAYQYGPQGVPSLALRRTPPLERVVAPYACALALPLAPRAALANLRRFARLGAAGPWGFLEALDGTASRQRGGSRLAPVATTMAHHQGMSLLALGNLLLDGLPLRWSLAEPQLLAVLPLLHERVPAEVAPLRRPLAAAPPSAAPATAAGKAWQPGAAAWAPTALLSNGRTSVALRPHGAGWMRWQGIDLGRWRDEALADAHGHFLYLQRADAPLASLTLHPAADPAATYEASAEPDRVHFCAHWPLLRARCTVWVSPVDDLELRRVELWNTGSTALDLRLLSAFELSLSDAAADEAHPAFAKLFVRAAWDADTQALSAERRPRREGEAACHALHFVVHAEALSGPVLALAERARWLGRLGSRAQPLADFAPADALSGPRATGLDPMAALALPLHLPPHGRATLLLGTAAAAEPATLRALLARCRQAGARALPEADAPLPEGRWPAGEPPRLGDVALDPGDEQALQQLSTALLLLLTRPPPPLLEAGGEPLPCPHDALWRLGVSGELPLLSLHIGSARGLRTLRQLLQGQRLWDRAGLRCDLVIVNTEAQGYLMPLQHELQTLVERQRTLLGADPKARLHLWMLGALSAAEQRSLALHARVRLQLDGRGLPALLAPLNDWHAQARTRREAQRGQRLPPPAAAPARAAQPAPGGFSAGGQRYQFSHHAGAPTPRPWINVLANPDFGTLVSETGGGCTWAGNSRLRQLTPWSNDPLLDLDGESLWLQNVDDGQAWRVGRAPSEAQPCTLRHEAGQTRLLQRLGGIALEARWSVDRHRAVKRLHLLLHNPGPRARQLRLLARVDWQLGAERSARRSLHTACHRSATPTADVELLLARQLDGPGGTAFLALQALGAGPARLDDWTCDRREFFDAAGREQLPRTLGRQDGAGLDPCAAVAQGLRLAPGARIELQLLLGHAEDTPAALRLAAAALAEAPRRAQGRVRQQWRELQAGVQVRSPDPLFDALVNHWLLYQVLGCRLWARAGFYQAGGAYGFRDQLQDAMALDHAAPGLLKAQILRAASRQFEAGDVQHWWHPPGGAGVRTHCSDDRLWLPQALLHALRSGHHPGLLDARAPFLHAAPLPLGQDDRYDSPGNAEQDGTLYEHAARALDCSLTAGEHGLPLIGSGDWNDGMNRVGTAGRGESVWLAWLLVPLVEAFAPLAQQRGEPARARRWLQAAQGWRQALQGPAWDGAWYRRAFFDDGSPLGSARQAECRIDLIAQAWSVLSGVAPPERQAQALRATETELARPGLMPLLTPPLQRARPDAGYIQAYPPGVRENGGQYNHAVVWALMAQAQRGEAAVAWRLFREVSPAHRSAEAAQGPRYGLEPYAVAADVQTEGDDAGRGGWSWTTGSAAWLHRAALGSLLGLQRDGRRIRFTPCLPPDWSGATLLLRDRGRRLRFWLPGRDSAPPWAQAATGLPWGGWMDLDQVSGRAWRLERTFSSTDDDSC